MNTKSLMPLTLLALAACGFRAEAPEQCPGLPSPEGDVVTTLLPIALFAGETPLVPGETVRTEDGLPYEVEKLKWYVSELELVREDGSHEHALLVDGGGEALAYGVHLVDASDDDSLALSFRAPRGTYQGLRFTVGVPATCPDQQTELNHVDASEMLPPLDVDSDMYWSWNPGYVHFKIEGRAGADRDSFFYHVGGDERLAHVALEGELLVEDGVSPTAVAFDVNRVFVSPDGEAIPRLDGHRSDRMAHSGPMADQVKRNLEGSSAFELR